MLKTQTTETKLDEFSRGNARTQLMANTRNRNRVIKKMDIAITDRVDEVLWSDEVLRMDYKEIDVYIEDQILYLSGHVVSTMNQQRVDNAIRAIPGILEVKNMLYSDDTLTREVAGALGCIEHVYKVKFFTGVRHGVVALNGEVSDINVRSLAEKCASSISGVRGVINHIRTPGVDRKVEDIRFFQPMISEQIYFRDGPSGIVKQVIINPNNRLVVAMVVQGYFIKSPYTFRSMINMEVQSSKKVVIPTREIRYLTKRSGFLNIKSVETERYGDFDPRGFIPPKRSWEPPFPYYLEDVLFPAEYGETMHQAEDEAFPEPLDVPIGDSLPDEQTNPMVVETDREYKN
jgi:osmotically-inducible protein OsmY